MPDTTALLSEERLEQIKDRFDSHERTHIATVALRYGHDVADLLADRTAFRLQVAEQLRGLLKPMDGYETSPSGYIEMCRARNHNIAIHATAKALGIELT